jgi:O-antigen/teichoic acid export membrane protein
MRFLDMHELGLITILQTVILLVSMLQFGLINGGYRIFSLGVEVENRKINNLFFSFIGLLAIFLFSIWIVFLFLKKELSDLLLFFSLVAGIMWLMVNWLTNMMIGRQLLGQLNRINVISGVGSAILLPLAYIFKLYGAILVLLAQPLIFIVYSFGKYSDLRPTGFLFNIKLTKKILHYGFIPFLAGVFLLINTQIERWSILNILGTEELGRFYLVFLFSTFFILIPNSFLNLFFPQCIKYYESKDYFLFKKQLKKYTILLTGYMIIAVLCTIFLLRPFISLFLPSHNDNISFVFYYLPGLLALCFCAPFTLVFNASVELNPILLAEGTSVLVNAVIIFVIRGLGIFSLLSMSFIKSFVNIYILLFYSFSLFFVKNKLFKEIAIQYE